MILKTSQVWTISSADLIAHLESLDAPDQIYWDSRELKKTGQKFQKLAWSNWPRPAKIDGEWTFVREEVKAEAPAVVPVVQPVAPAAPKVFTPPPAAKIADDDAVRAALAEIDDQLSLWVAGGMQHPAPAVIGEVKARLGCGWTQIQRTARAMVQP